jgi:hypothetical protein
VISAKSLICIELTAETCMKLKFSCMILKISSHIKRRESAIV